MITISMKVVVSETELHDMCSFIKYNVMKGSSLVKLRVIISDNKVTKL